MYPRCANTEQAVASGRRPQWVLLAALALAACGSNPSTPDTSPAPVEAQTAPAAPPAAQTFPLENEALPPAASTQGNAAAATSLPPATSAKPSAADPSALGAAEPSLPPEVVQQFDDAVAMVSSGNLAAAEPAFRALSAAYPSYSGPLVNLGILQAKQGRLDEAEKTFNEAIGRRADNAAAYNQLGIVYRRQGRFGEAEQAYTRALEIDPNYANAHLNLGVLCDLYLQQPQRALEAFERYLALSPAPDEKVTAWVKELKVRLESAQRAAGAG